MTPQEIFSTFQDHTTVKFVHFESDTNSASFECNLVLNLVHEASNSESIVIFNGVSGLQLNNFGGGLTQIVGLELIDLRDQQWSEIKYQINDTENSAISFYCKSMQLAGPTCRT